MAILPTIKQKKEKNSLSDNNFSRTKSLLKKEEEKIRPLIEKILTKIEICNLLLFFIQEINFLCWPLKLNINKIPQPQNSNVLNKAWKNICVPLKAKSANLIKKTTILICLIVEKATIFFKSNSALAKKPPTRKVIKETKKGKM